MDKEFRDFKLVEDFILNTQVEIVVEFFEAVMDSAYYSMPQYAIARNLEELDRIVNSEEIVRALHKMPGDFLKRHWVVYCFDDTSIETYDYKDLVNNLICANANKITRAIEDYSTQQDVWKWYSASLPKEVADLFDAINEEVEQR